MRAQVPQRPAAPARRHPRARGHRRRRRKRAARSSRRSPTSSSSTSRRTAASAMSAAARPRAIPSTSANSIASVADNAAAAGVDVLVTIYHACHRQLSGAEAHYPFAVKNFTDLLAEALGTGGRHDYYKQYKRGGEMDEAIAAAKSYLARERRHARRGDGDGAHRRDFQRDRHRRRPRPLRDRVHRARVASTVTRSEGRRRGSALPPGPARAARCWRRARSRSSCRRRACGSCPGGRSRNRS